MESQADNNDMVIERVDKVSSLTALVKGISVIKYYSNSSLTVRVGQILRVKVPAIGRAKF